MSQFDPVVRCEAGKQEGLSLIPLWLSSKVCGHCLVTLPLAINETLKWLSYLNFSVQGCSGGGSVVRGTVSLFPHLLGFWSLLVPLRRELGVKQV